MQQNYIKSSLINGILIIGGLLSLKFLLSASKIGVLGLIANIISILIIYLMYRFSTQYRENECNGSISYGKAFGFIFKLYFYGTIISSLIALFYTSVINKDFLPVFLNDILSIYDKMNFPINDSTYKIFEVIYKPIPFALLNISSGIFTATFWGLIWAAFVKKDKGIFE